MTRHIDELPARMEAAAAALDFKEALALRDRIALLRGGASADAADAVDTSGIDRQHVAPPPGWTPPPRPDLMTTGRNRRN